MNIKLLPNDINVDFMFVPPEIYKSNEDIKLLSINDVGTVVIIVTKSNEIRIFDFLGKSVLFKITHFSELSYKVVYISWNSDSSSIYVTYENSEISGYQRIDFNFHDQPPYTIPLERDNMLISCESKANYIKEARYFKNSKKEFIYITGVNPCIIDCLTKEVLYFFNQTKINGNKNIIYVKEAANPNTYYLIVKELYMIMYAKVKETGDEKSMKDVNTSKLSYDQIVYMNFISSALNNDYYIYDIFSLVINGEITSIQLNDIQSLMLINSSDRVLRLYRIVDETITLQKDYSDSVNKKRWVASYFYTYKIKKGYQDLIITALCDSNSLEFTFIDIETGKIIKKLEPFKYTVQDFICHYNNHFSLLVISNKKLFYINGYMVNQWGCFAPGLRYIEENIDYIEDESFFDMFIEKMKQNIKKETYKGNKIDDCFLNSSSKRKNLFFKYEIKEEEDVEKEKSMNELKELFNYMNEEME